MATKTSVNGTKSDARCAERAKILNDLKRLAVAAAEFTAMPAFRAYGKEYARYKQFRGHVIAIEGIIGAGKTTLGEKLAAYLNKIGIRALFLEEKTIKSNMDLFYKDLDDDIHPNRYAHVVQDDMLRQCQIVYEKAKTTAERENVVVIVDRTIFGNAVFEMMHHVNGNISEKEHLAYMEVLAQYAPYAYDYVIYLDLNPKRALEMIKQRAKNQNRKNERNIPIEYLHDLERAYYIQIIAHVRAKHVKILAVQNDVFYDEVDAVLDKLVGYASNGTLGTEAHALDETRVLQASEDMLDPEKVRAAFHYLRSWTNNLCCSENNGGTRSEESSRSGSPSTPAMMRLSSSSDV